VILARSAVMVTCFWNCVFNVVQIFHIIAENDPHLFRSVLLVGDRARKKITFKISPKWPHWTLLLTDFL